MAITTELSSAEQRVLDWFRGAERSAVRHEFRSLPPPQMDRLEGEFEAELLDQAGRFCNLLTRGIFASYGQWIGKAFRPLGDNVGVGYNFFQDGPKTVPSLLMDWRIAKSTLDDGQSLIINYRERNRGIIRWLTGELREAHPRIWVGIGTFGPKLGRRDAWRRRIPFLLVGPCRPYQLPAE